MKRLPLLRKKIDKIDHGLSKLLHERMKVAALIGRIKERNKAPVADPKRESEIFEKLEKLARDPITPQSLLAIFREIIFQSKILQSKPSVAYLGPKGTFSYFATEDIFGKYYHPIECSTFDELLNEVKFGQAHYAVVPFKSNANGMIKDTESVTLSPGLFVERQFILKVNLCLLAPKKIPLREIERVYSHPQVFMQAPEWLKKNCPGAQWIETASTSEAVERTKREPNVAAVGHEKLSELFKVRIIEKGIQDRDANFTQFFIMRCHRS